MVKNPPANVGDMGYVFVFSVCFKVKGSSVRFEE